MMQMTIEMPSGMSSRHRDYDESVAKSYVAQMKAWPNFEAALVLIEDGKEVSRERIKM